MATQVFNNPWKNKCFKMILVINRRAATPRVRLIAQYISERPHRLYTQTPPVAIMPLQGEETRENAQSSGRDECRPSSATTVIGSNRVKISPGGFAYGAYVREVRIV